MKITVVEGTPAELAEALPRFFSNFVVASVNGDSAAKEFVPMPVSQKHSDPAKYVSREVATEFFQRIPLNEKQKGVFLTILAAHPKLVASPSIQKAIAYGSSQFAGLMGALGRRLANTSGYLEGTRLLVEVWDDQAFVMNYRLPDSVHEALVAEPWVREADASESE